MQLVTANINADIATELDRLADGIGELGFQLGGDLLRGHRGFGSVPVVRGYFSPVSSALGAYSPRTMIGPVSGPAVSELCNPLFML